MRILLLTGDVWNDTTNGNNIYTNWFDNFDAEFANIYLSPGIPENNICTRYFQVTDKMMALSFFSKRAGLTFISNNDKSNSSQSSVNAEQKDLKLYSNLKKFAGEPLRLVRDLLWSFGRYDIDALKKFIDDFNPDIVFCPHLFSLKYRRIERIIHSITDAPMVAFTGDAEASLNNKNYNPLFWMRQLLLHHLYKKHIKIFKHYFTFSQSQCEEITAKYGVPAETLYKCAVVQPYTPKNHNDIIKIVYAGRLYCNRWKTISAIGDALVHLNENGCKAILYVYTHENLTSKQLKALSKDKFIHFMGAIHPSKLPDVYANADIALHVESLDKKYSLATMHSFSTKIVDLLSYNSAILAICSDFNNGWNYLKQEHAAICISDYSDILPTLQTIVANPSILNEYSQKARLCLIKNHSRSDIQQRIQRVFTSIIEQNL